jgi:hypothetical protein
VGEGQRRRGVERGVEKGVGEGGGEGGRKKRGGRGAPPGRRWRAWETGTVEKTVGREGVGTEVLRMGRRWENVRIGFLSPEQVSGNLEKILPPVNLAGLFQEAQFDFIESFKCGMRHHGLRVSAKSMGTAGPFFFRH